MMAGVKTMLPEVQTTSPWLQKACNGTLEVAAYDQVPNKSAITFTICDDLECAAGVLHLENDVLPR